MQKVAAKVDPPQGKNFPGMQRTAQGVGWQAFLQRAVEEAVGEKVVAKKGPRELPKSKRKWRTIMAVLSTRGILRG